MRNLGTAFSAMVGAATGGIGGIGQQLNQALQGVIGFKLALNDLSAANTAIKDAGNAAEAAAATAQKSLAVLGVIGQAAGFLGEFVGGLAGPSAAEVERDNILRENNRRLDDLRSSLDRTLRGPVAAARAGDVAGVLARSSVIRDPEDLSVIARSGQESVNEKEFRRQLAAAGFTIEAFARIVKETTGLDILDKKGRIVADTLDQVNEGFRLAAAAAIEFSNSIAAMQSRLENEDVFGIGGRSTDPAVAQIERNRQILLDKAVLTDAEEARIRALDLTTDAGRAEYFRILKALAQRVKDEQITREEIVSFEDIEEFFDHVADGARAINAFNEAVKAATDAMRDFNLPSGFRREAIAFETATPGGPEPPVAPPLKPEHFTPPLPPGIVPGSDGARAPDFTAVRVEAGAIVVHTSPGQTPEEIAQVVLAKLRELAMSQSGDTMQVGFN